MPGPRAIRSWGHPTRERAGGGWSQVGGGRERERKRVKQWWWLHHVFCIGHPIHPMGQMVEPGFMHRNIEQITERQV